jgi:hypothetical protein
MIVCLKFEYQLEALVEIQSMMKVVSSLALAAGNFRVIREYIVCISMDDI